MTLLILTIFAIISGILFLYLTHLHYKTTIIDEDKGKSTITYILMEFASILVLIIIFWQFFYMMSIYESLPIFTYFMVTSVVICYLILFDAKAKLPFDLLSKFKSRSNFKSFASIGMYLSLEEVLLIPIVFYYLIQYGITI